MRRGIQLMPDGEINALNLDDGRGGMVVLQNAVDGYYQALDFSDDLTFWCNEEGKYQEGLEFNPFATALFRTAYGLDPKDNTADFIMGPAAFTGTPDSEGETRGLPQQEEDDIREFVEIALLNPSVLPTDPRASRS